MNVLGVPVSADLHGRWLDWLAPEVQPFFVDSIDLWPKGKLRAGHLIPELRDTYRTWNVDRSLEVLWLDESSFLAMTRSQRSKLLRTQVKHGRGAVPSVRSWSDVLDPEVLRSRAGGHRFVWWPSLVQGNPQIILSRVVTSAPDAAQVESLPSRHREVAKAVWDGCAGVLPGAMQIAGSFAHSSGPNCFGTLMAAAGVRGAADVLMLESPFLEWLGSACRPGGRDDDPGTVLVWRDRTGRPVHAAITIGDDWALEKASGEWWTPRAVRTVRDVIRTRRARGQRLERHRLVSA